MSNFVFAQYKPDGTQVTEAELLPYKQSFIVGQSGQVMAVTGTTTETTLSTVKIPGGIIGLNGSIRITSLWSCTNNANSKTFKINFGALSILSVINSTIGSEQLINIVRNRGSFSSQVIFPAASNSPIGSAGTAPTIGTVDTSLDVSIVFTGTLGNAGDTITLEAYTIEVLPS